MNISEFVKFDEFVGELLTPVVLQQIRKLNGEDNPLKIVRSGTIVNNTIPGRFIIKVSNDCYIIGFERE